MGRPLKNEGSRKAPRIPDPDDDLQQKATEAAAEAAGKMLESIGINRPISSISWTELQWVAAAAVTGWVCERARQYQQLKDTPQGASIAEELMGG